MSNSFQQPLTLQEENEYLKLLAAGDTAARDVLIERNLRLVAHIVKKYSGSGICTDDLISIGTIGLIKAVNTYNQRHTARLGTYAAKCIENEILMQFRAGKKTRLEVSLSEPLGTDKDGNEISYNQILGTDPDAIVDDLHLKLQSAELYKALKNCLTQRERQVICMRYGLYDSDPITQREIAAKLNISRSYVSRIEKKALQKLAACLNDV